MIVSENFRLPLFTNVLKIAIVCEGKEEYDYLNRLLELNVWNDIYDITLFDAKGNGNISAVYQDKFQSGTYDIVLIFCDTERKPYEQYKEIKNKINDFHGCDEIADKVIIYGNPCTLQIVLLHWADVRLTKVRKSKNAPYVEKYTGICGYKAKDEQRTELMSKITRANYDDMLQRLQKLPADDKIVSSSNFFTFIERFTSADDSWIDEINSMIDAVE